jgi:DNA polymerase-3 subunit beta
MDCIDRSTILVKEGDKKPIIIDIKDDSMDIRINSTIGSLNDSIDIQKDGNDILIGFNPKFLMDVLRVIDDDTAEIYLQSPKSPCIIKDDEGSYIYLILPVNINTVN